MALPRGAMGLSAVCDCGISWSYSQFFMSTWCPLAVEEAISCIVGSSWGSHERFFMNPSCRIRLCACQDDAQYCCE